jgi:large subunit ribosomal protein L30
VPKIAITWKRSTIGFPRGQRATIAGLGLHRLHHRVEHEDTPSIRGMVRKVQHLVEIEELPSTRSKSPKSKKSS